MKKKITIGTRGSKLALWQANWVKGKLNEWFPEIETSLEIIKTQGDKILDVPLAKIGGKGLFVKEIEDALISGKVDIAVHSMKDVPVILPGELFIAAVTKREDPRDALLSREGKGLKDLEANTRIGTSSLRRKSQLLNFNSSFNILPLRGNVDTRLKKLENGDFDAIIAAASGLCRLGCEENITEYLPIDNFLPAIGQGALGIETRKDDNEIIEILKGFNHFETSIAVTAERAFLKRLEGGCQVPIAAYSTVLPTSTTEIDLEGLVCSEDGKRLIRKKDRAHISKAYELGDRLAKKLLDEGADKILSEVYKNG